MIKILIVDDHQVLVDGLTMILNDESHIQVVGSAGTAKDALTFLDQTKVDLILLDVNLPDMNGISLCKLIHKSRPDINVLAMSMYDKPSFVKQMFRGGAKGYILKNSGQENFIQAINTVMSGEMYMSNSIAEMLSKGSNYSTNNPGSVPELSKRENEILGLIASELTNNEIAEKIHLSLPTIETHRKNLLIKFGARNTAGLMRSASELGFL